jgi:Lrp/AsnC family leucine-responsive transcriptional regulator
MNVDSTDVELLRALQEDARQSFRSLAKRVGVSVPTVSARIANLEALGILAGYHAAIDPELLHQTRLVLWIACRPNRADAVGQRLAKLPEIRWMIRVQGSRLVAEAVVPRAASVQPLLRKVRSIDGVRAARHQVAEKRFKDAPRALISTGLSAMVACFECGRPIEGQPVKLRLDGRVHYLCCSSCERLYQERYDRVQAALKAG